MGNTGREVNLYNFEPRFERKLQFQECTFEKQKQQQKLPKCFLRDYVKETELSRDTLTQ